MSIIFPFCKVLYMKAAIFLLRLSRYSLLRRDTKALYICRGKPRAKEKALLVSDMLKTASIAYNVHGARKAGRLINLLAAALPGNVSLSGSHASFSPPSLIEMWARWQSDVVR